LEGEDVLFPRLINQGLSMANIKSQIKRNRQNEVRRLRNKSVRSEVKTAMKRVLDAAQAGESADGPFRQAQKKIDKAVAKGVIKPTTAARQKSRLAAKL
jgi:small subunit ribosomal protein S20